MSLLIWAGIGIVLGFALSALMSRRLNHRIAPAVLLVLCLIALGVARWADRPGSAMLQAQAFVVGWALLSAVAGSVGWLAFARQRWAMIASAVVSVALIAALPLVLRWLAGVVGI